MKLLSLIILLLTASQWAFAQNNSAIFQIKYSPWGGIDADEDDFSLPGDTDYSKYNMTFERSYSAKLIIEPFYISAQRSNTDAKKNTPEAKVETFSIGLAGINYDPFESSNGAYLIGGLGIGVGTFTFKNPALDDDELLFEANAEIGFHLAQHLLLGTGIDFQHFGEFGESKASSWTFYFSTGIVF